MDYQEMYLLRLFEIFRSPKVFYVSGQVRRINSFPSFLFTIFFIDIASPEKVLFTIVSYLFSIVLLQSQRHAVITVPTDNRARFSRVGFACGMPFPDRFNARMLEPFDLNIIRMLVPCLTAELNPPAVDVVAVHLEILATGNF